MTPKQKTRVDDVATIEATVIAALGDDLAPPLRVQVRRASQLQALADRARQQALDGETFDTAEIVRLEALASESVKALNLI